eukprot:7139921-Pyramimonas_sp.AAC.1
MRKSQEWCAGTAPHRQDTTVMVIRGVEVQGMMFWHDSGSRRFNSNGVSPRRSPRSDVLTQLRMFK